MRQRLAILLWVITGAAFHPYSYGQQCTNRFLSVIHKGISFDTFTCATSTQANEFVAAGNIYSDHGFAAKFSSQGTPLFSYQYNPVYQMDRTYYQQLRFTDIVQTKDGGFVLAGIVLKIKYVFQREYKNHVGVLLKIDPYGNVIWCKQLESANAINNSGFELSITNVVETTSGDLIAYLASNYNRNYPAYGRIICLDQHGQLKWNTLLATNDFDGGDHSLKAKRGMLQTRDGLVVIADLLYKNDQPGTSPAMAARLHLFSLNPTNGKIQWENNYHFPPGTPAHITGLSELPDRQLIVGISAYPAGADRRGLLIKADRKGILQSAYVYSTTGSHNTQLLDVSMNPSNEVVCLFKNDDNSIVASVNIDGTIQWQQGLSNSNGKFPANCFSSSGKGFGVFMSNFQTWESRLLITDHRGRADCANTPVQITTEPITILAGEPLVTEPNIPDQNRFGIANFPINATPYVLQKRIECEEQSNCCFDKIDSTRYAAVDICEGTSYTLPNNTVVGSTGRYFIIDKTTEGCDSITFFNIRVNKQPYHLTLGNDQCLEGQDSLILKATEGYSHYYWMSSSTASDSFFKVTRPGTYWVTVSNICGNKTDSITLFDQCDFPIYMPGAFSPNSDGKNDVFGLPSMNKNRFVSLRIFNRWGQLVFSSKDPNNGWDGKFNNLPQGTGVYVYYLEMMGLSGRRLTKKGTVLLIR